MMDYPKGTETSVVEELERQLPALRPRLHRYCASMVGSAIDGEDVLQEALFNAHAALVRRLSVDDLERWLFRIAHNAAVDYLRRRNRERLVLVENAELDHVEDRSMSIEQRQNAAIALRTLMHLTLLQRSTVILFDVLGLTLEEAAAVIGNTLAGTKAALHRGRERLAELAGLADDAPAPTIDAEEERRLRRYIDRFNARDFDAIRTMVAEDVELELVDKERMRGKRDVSRYFGNYASKDDWVLSFAFIDRRPAIVMHDPREPGSDPYGFMLIGWRDGRVSAIRDFRYARYAIEVADIQAADPDRHEE